LSKIIKDIFGVRNTKLILLFADVNAEILAAGGNISTTTDEVVSNHPIVVLEDQSFEVNGDIFIPPSDDEQQSNIINNTGQLAANIFPPLSAEQILNLQTSQSVEVLNTIKDSIQGTVMIKRTTNIFKSNMCILTCFLFV